MKLLKSLTSPALLKPPMQIHQPQQRVPTEPLQRTALEAFNPHSSRWNIKCCLFLLSAIYLFHNSLARFDLFFLRTLLLLFRKLILTLRKCTNRMRLISLKFHRLFPAVETADW